MKGGIVIHGDKLGKKYGFPTANLDVKKKDMKVAPGVYVAKAILNRQEFNAAVAIQGDPCKVEVFLLGYNNGDFYGKYVEIELMQKISEMEKFDKEKELKDKIKNDVLKVKEFFK